jgi:predicted RNase H-like HicB family nuclease
MANLTTKAYGSVIFRVTIRRADDVSGYWAVCDMPGGGCTAQGDTLQETQKNILEAAGMYLEDYPDVINYCLLFEVENA